MPERLTLEICQRTAAGRGGVCLSKTYVNVKTVMNWQCANGHEWPAKAQSIREGRWCPTCGVKLSLEIARKLAEARGGTCLSTEYTGSLDYMEWRCSHGHEWRSTLNHVKNSGSWCPTCAYALRAAKLISPNNLKSAQQIATSHNGQCLETQNFRVSDHVNWRCTRGHTWSAQFSSVQQGSWCPVCRTNTEENRCRSIFEAITGRRFPNVRPQWLNGLELDGFCEELRIAFEYNGRQHYEVHPIWHPNGEKDLARQKERDMRKTAQCDENWVTLITIPYTMPNKEHFITSELAHLVL